MRTRGRGILITSEVEKFPEGCVIGCASDNRVKYQQAATCQGGASWYTRPLDMFLGLAKSLPKL